MAAAQSSIDPVVAQELQESYPGGVGTIDAFEGGLSEYPVPGSDVGPTFQAIMVDQFTRLRDGDRFFYLNENFNSDEMNIFQQTSTLAKVIMANTNVTNIQGDAIFFHASISGTVSVTGGRNNPDNITLNLEDTSGDILATTTTNPQGQYSFDQLSGPAADPTITPGVSTTGTYQVVVVVPAGLRQIGSNPSPILIIHGDTAVNGVNFSLSSPTPPPPPPPPARMPPPPPGMGPMR
jgi:hypothetical protein